MTFIRRSVDPLAVAYVFGCVAWFIPQQYVGTYRGLFSEPFQRSLSLTIVIGFGVLTCQVVKMALKKRTFPWAPTTILVVLLGGMDLIWRMLIVPLPGGDLKIGWVTMLFAQPVLAAAGVLIIARAWRDFSLHQQRDT